MTALRTTGAERPTRAPALRAGVAGALVLGVFGCGTPSPPPAPHGPQPTAAAPLGANDPAWLTSREKLPAPDLDRLDYDPEKRTLGLYDLPGRDQWMVQLPNEAAGHLIGPSHRLPEGIDTGRTLVYYARPGVKASAAVTVASIEAGRRPHASLAFNR
ncbi:hypothetical protein [Gemmata sp.]|uniref:hypothetical protein n=1 Tax=Gemmata sp. TaxID=1914242 RepID=UPI003F6FA2A9